MVKSELCAFVLRFQIEYIPAAKLTSKALPHNMNKFLIFLASFTLVNMIDMAQASTTKTASISADQFIANYSKAYTDLGLGGEMDLSYQKQIQSFLIFFT